MALHALDDLDDAYDVTRRFLLPFDLRRWAKLAIVALFVGAPGASIFQFNASSGGTSTEGANGAFSVPVRDIVVDRRVLLLVAAVIVAAALVGLLFVLIGSITEFVLIESLRAEAVMIRRYWSRRWGQGLRLFGFRLALGLVALVPIALFVAFAVLPYLLTGNPLASAAVFVLLVPLFFLVTLFLSVVNGFTTAFVVPIMVLEDCGVLAGWRRLWPAIRSKWKQYAAYAVLAFVLAIAAGILIGLAMVPVAVALLIPFGLLGGIGYLLVSVSSPVGFAVIAVAAAAFLFALLAGYAVVSVPVVTYLRYYALLVLGDTNDEFDLIPGLRAAVREGVPE